MDFRSDRLLAAREPAGDQVEGAFLPLARFVSAAARPGERAAATRREVVHRAK